MTSFIQQPFLVTSRKFPEEGQFLSEELTKMYNDVAFATNAREIALYEKAQLNTGQKWFNDAEPTRRHSVFRRVYSIPATTAGNQATIPHQITGDFQVTHMWGTVQTNVPDQRPVPYSSVTAITANISLKIDANNIIIRVGATSPNVLSGTCVIEYFLRS